MRMAIQFEQKQRYGVDDLLHIMEILRSREGCPWDREQTHESIRRDFVEETYEVLEAIDRQDPALLREELGDVLLQVVFHARMEEEAGRFAFADVVDEVCRKLIVRHPHIFAGGKADTSEEVLRNWDRIKQKNKGQTTVTETLESVAKSLPALMYAEKVQKRAEKGGCALPDAETIAAQLAQLAQEPEERTGEEREKALGDLLFAAVALCRSWGLDPEQSLVQSTERFIARHGEAEQDGRERALFSLL